MATTLGPHWHTRETSAVLGELAVDPARGLSAEEVETRRARYGPNELAASRGRSPLRILGGQLGSTMVLILFAASAVSVLAGDPKNAAVILAIVCLFAALGFVQEYRAERAMAALRRLAVPVVRVRRGGGVAEVSARELVPGDLVLLEAGNVVPADCRLVESASLRAQESALTGESEPVEKTTSALGDEGLALGDRRNLVFLGTLVTYGRGVAVVVATGMTTELGRVAGLVERVETEPTPLQRRLDALGKLIGAIAVAVAALVFALGVLRGEPLGLMLMTAVGVAVAAVPEGLPAVVTITLALGAQRMLGRNALIRKLPAVETLGSVTVICSDKTGTLTRNRMTVAELVVDGKRVDLRPDAGGEVAPGSDADAVELLLAAGALCSDAVAAWDRHSGAPCVLGDPTEAALVDAAARQGLWKSDLDRALPRVAEMSFDADRKRMTTVHRYAPADGPVPGPLAMLGRPPAVSGGASPEASEPGAPFVAFTKGAVDVLLDVSSHVWTAGGRVALDAAARAAVLAANDDIAGRGMRVLGVAYRRLDPAHVGDMTAVERGLTFVGLVAMTDAPRPEVRDAIATCTTAGIRTCMITGDHPRTALAVARELGLETSDAVTGSEIDGLSTDELRDLVGRASVYARVSPEHKYRVVAALQSRGEVVAMTGDGVNDAPALRKADIGVAMGLGGTDVAKEAADMVLSDDNFATIVAAVEEGRVIYDNLRKFLEFSIAGNIGKIAVVLVAPLVAALQPLLPLQLLWLNLLTDGLLGLGIGLENAERGVMSRPPLRATESIFARGMGLRTVWVGGLIGLLSLAVGLASWRSGDEHWQTILFTSLAFAQVGQAFAIRSNRDSLLAVGPLSNRTLTGLAGLVVVLQTAVVYWPPAQSLFATKALPAVDLALCVAVGGLVFAAIEIAKWRSAERRRTPSGRGRSSESRA